MRWRSKHGLQYTAPGLTLKKVRLAGLPAPLFKRKKLANITEQRRKKARAPNQGQLQQLWSAVWVGAGVIQPLVLAC
jgi:hypothetical protein